MASKIRVKSPAKQGVARGAQFTKDKKIESHANSLPITKPLEHTSMQHAYGNKALRRLAHSMQMEQQLSHIAKGLHSPYDRLAHQLGAQMLQEGKGDLLVSFDNLTRAQKIAVLRAVLGSGVTSHGVIKDGVDWGKLESSINAVQGVELQNGEPEVEADVTESGAVTADGSVDVSGFLAPYKSIIVWLNYKANKQGKGHVMQYFESLSIPQKKIAIHKINKWKKLHFDTFTEALSIHVLLKQWVNWDTVLAAMRSAKQIKVEHLNDDVLEKLTSQQVHEGDGHDMASMQDEEEDEGFDLLGLLGTAMATATNSNKERQLDTGPDERADLKQFLDDPSRMSWLLLGKQGAADIVSVMLTFYKNRTNKVDIVDRYLNVQDKSPEKAREHARNQQLQKLGFKTLEQCYAHIMNELASMIFEKGVMAEDKAFAVILQNMRLPSGTGTTTKMMIAEKLN